MKARTYLSISILVIVIMIMIGSCATRKKAISEEDFFKAWSGTWINIDYKSQKKITHPDGTRDNFYNVSNPIPSSKEKITILEQWSDSKGTIWYRGQSEYITPFTSKSNECD